MHPIKTISWIMLLSFVSLNAVAADLILVRHGNSDHNLTKVYNSNPDHPNYRVSHLTALGREQAKKTAKKLLENGYSDDNIEVVYVSPLPRTQETALIMAEAGLFNPKKIIIDLRLIDNIAGDLENTPSEYQYIDPALHGETREQVIARMTAIYDQVTVQNPEKNVLFVSHSTPAAELIEVLTLQSIALKTADCMVLPIKQRYKK
ncbi:MAG: histidine phosphatase family protein [Pseudomonadota bacterium]